MALIVACAGELPPELQHGKSGGGDTGGAPANTGGMDASTGGMNGGTGGMAMGTGGGSGLQNCDMAASIIKSQCNICHSKASSASFANLDLESSGVGSRLVGKDADTSSAGMCSGKGKLIVANSNPATGILIDKINNRQTCGSQMPPAKLSADQISCLTQWATYLAAGNN